MAGFIPTPTFVYSLDNCTDAETYVHLYSRFVTEALSTPYIIGFNKCHYQDEIRANLLKQGLVHKNGEPYTTIDGIAGAKRALKLAYEIQK